MLKEKNTTKDKAILLKSIISTDPFKLGFFVNHILCKQVLCVPSIGWLWKSIRLVTIIVTLGDYGGNTSPNQMSEDLHDLFNFLQN